MLFLCLFFVPQTALGENNENKILVQAEFPKTLRHTASARVERVIDEKSVLMTDGKIVRLLGIDFPFVDEGDDAIFVASKTRLEELLPKGTEVMLYQTRNQSIRRENRMGQVLAHLANKKTGEWVNGAIVRDGLAYAVTDSFNPDMAADLYALEDLGRKEGKGLWAKGSAFGVLAADAITDAAGTFRVVEGTVQKAAMSRNNLYLNFGPDWKKDFTVQINPLLRRAFTKAGINPLDLAGKQIRVRGWIRDWNGPFMELETVERLEILSPEKPTPPGEGVLSEAKDG